MHGKGMFISLQIGAAWKQLSTAVVSLSDGHGHPMRDMRTHEHARRNLGLAEEGFPRTLKQLKH